MAKNGNNVQGVLFLRNGALYDNRKAALSAIQENKNLVGDGQFILARYNASDSTVKTLVGVNYASGSTKHLTIIDVEGAGADVEKLRQEINAKLGGGISSANTVTAQLQALSGNSATDSSATTSVEGAKKYAKDYTDEQIGTLDYTDTAETGSYVSKVDQVDGKISTTKVALPTVAAISEAGKPIIAVAEDKGTISASAGTINAEYVNIADAASKFSATTVEGALAELDDKIVDVVDGLDYTDTAVTGSYVSKVDEVNGVISVTREELPTVTGEVESKKVVMSVSEDKGEISVTKGTIESADKTVVISNLAEGNGIDFSVNIDNETLKKDENGVISVASAALTQYVGDEDTIHVSAVDANNEKTISSYLTIQKVTTGLSEEVKEEYHLIGHSGTTIGDPVKIYKDSHIVSITYISDSGDTHYQNLEYKYIDASGNTQTTYVDMSEIILEAEFASGITVTNHVAHGVVDPTSEAFLTVGADGFKLAGVQNAIDSAIEALDATGGTQTIATGKHVAVEVIEENGKITAATVVEDNIADADDLAQEILDREAGDTALSNRLGDAVTAENTAAAQLAALSGNSATDTSATTSVEGAKRYADAKLAEVVSDLDADLSGNSTHVTVGVVEENGKITAVTVAEDNIADADDLAELSGKTITAITSNNGSITASIDDAAGCKSYDLATDADKIKMSGFSAENTTALSGIAESDSIATAFEKTNAVITENERVTAAALNDLDERLDEIESGYVETVKVNNVALPETDNAVNVQIKSSEEALTPTGNEAIVIDQDSSTGAITLGLGYIDCGTY